jgi:hypothetical protein
MRQEKAQVSRRKSRTLVRRDLDPIGLASLPETIGLSRGRLEVSFRSIEELVESLYVLARVHDHTATRTDAGAVGRKLPDS